ncbi:hypothetical protein DPEC_G00034800 [Dallia pectoralis]|uniref:Uncharacterized protein n=1 Tax=Dallia pectoralis TaxID=75939 RepID=A0ACC2HDU5_DALPE|nr:hypothetical protein DPEC_G00034800 [Dallia pectoralis]
MAHAASALKKNRDVDVNAIEDEKEKKRRTKKLASREQKRKDQSRESTCDLNKGLISQMGRQLIKRNAKPLN